MKGMDHLMDFADKNVAPRQLASAEECADLHRDDVSDFTRKVTMQTSITTEDSQVWG